MREMVRLVAVLAPLLLSILLGWAVLGPLSLGSGEKDIILVIPLLMWSFFYLVCHLILWWRHAAFGRSMIVSSIAATALVVVSWIVLVVVLQAGFRP
ncbi:MAG: hypothetical protein AB1898_13300 [Acidobacteriota bacterium]